MEILEILMIMKLQIHFGHVEAVERSFKQNTDMAF